MSKEVPGEENVVSKVPGEENVVSKEVLGDEKCGE